MGGVNIREPEALDVLSIKIQCDAHWNRHIPQCLGCLRRCKKYCSSSDFLTIYTTYIQIWNTTLIYRMLPHRQFWDLSTASRRGRSCLLVRVEYPILLIHWSILTLFYRYLNGIFRSSEKGDLLPRIMYSYVTLVFLDEHIHMWPIG